MPPSVADHASSLAAGLTRDLADLGPAECTAECAVRRAEVLEGIGQILHVIDATDQAVREAGEPGISGMERECYAGRLRWAAGMCNGLQQGVEDLVRYDTHDSPKDEYCTIAALLGECGQRITRLCLLVATPATKPKPAVAEVDDVDEQFNDYVAVELQRAVWRLGEFLRPAGDLLEMFTTADMTEIKATSFARRRVAGV